MKRIGSGLSALVLAAMAAAAPAQAGEEDFYRDKTVTMYVAGGVGGSYGVWAQLLTAHLSRFLPGKPTVIAQYLSGAGGAKCANYVYNVAPKDGTALGMMLKYIVVSEMLRRPGLRYKSAEWGWVASTQPMNGVMLLWRDGPAQTLADAQKKQVVVGSTGKSSETYLTPYLMNELLGTKFKIVTGYKSWGTITTALERGELEGRASSWEAMKVQKMDWLKSGRIVPIAQMGLDKEHGYENVPRLIDLAKDDLARQLFEFMGSGAKLGRIFVMPPGVPAARLAAMQKAFADASRDKAFLADAEKRGLEVEYAGPEEVEALVKRVLATPKPVVERARQAFGLTDEGKKSKK